MARRATRLRALGVVLGMALVPACTTAPSASGTKPNPISSSEVVLQARSGTDVRVQVELARTEAERARGLMFRRSLESGYGMLFLFPKSDSLKFWMRNTYIPLDMIFVDEAYKVVYIEENAEPLTETPRGPDTLSRYVIEVPGGWTKTHGIEAGVAVRLLGVPDAAAPSR